VGKFILDYIEHNGNPVLGKSVVQVFCTGRCLGPSLLNAAFARVRHCSGSRIKPNVFLYS
jgi:hypothetical protein